MSNAAVNVAVIHHGKILLTKRDDFHVWCLPSGGVEVGESLAEAAIRETKEETGIDVELTRLIGVYSRLGGIPDVHAVLYEARPIGGELRLQLGEAIAVKYFASHELPNELAFSHKKRILDAFDGKSGMSVKQEINTSGEVISDREKLYTLRDQSGLSPLRFYFERIEGSETRETVEIEDR
jgi:ADP-ribose pyrophosphatase YjhB (NUDIX family)